jgi:hypothetical protein
LSADLAALQAHAATQVPAPRVALWFDPTFHQPCGLLVTQDQAWWVTEVRGAGPLSPEWVAPTISLEPGPWGEAGARVLQGLLARVAAEQPQGLVIDGCGYWVMDGERSQTGNLAAAPAARALTRFVAALGSGPQRWRATRSAFSALARYAART